MSTDLLSQQSSIFEEHDLSKLPDLDNDDSFAPVFWHEELYEYSEN